MGALHPRHHEPRRGPRVASPGAAGCARTTARRHPAEPAGQPVSAGSVPSRLLGLPGHRTAAGDQRVPRWRPAQRADRRRGELRSDSPRRRRAHRGDPGPVGALRPKHARRCRQHHHAARPGAARARARDLGRELRPAELPAAAGRDGRAGRLLRGTTLRGRGGLARRLQHADRPVARQGRHPARRSGRDALVPVTARI